MSIEFKISSIEVCTEKEYDNDAVCFTVTTNKGRSFDFIENIAICSDGHLLPLELDSLIISKHMCGLHHLISSENKRKAMDFYYDLIDELDDILNSNPFVI